MMRPHTIVSSTIALAAVLSMVPVAPAQDYKLHVFKTTQLSDVFFCEGATFGDFNKDGKGDVASGPYWYEGPDFTKRHEIYPVKPFDPHGYSDNFFSWSHDFNGDGWVDYLVAGFPGKETFWFENPGKAGFDKHWTRHLALAVTDNESPNFVDITGDGKPELICSTDGYMGWAEPDASNPTKPWTFHKISPKAGYQRFTHGLGYGDVNGDGRTDLLEAGGWWEQPASLKGDPQWTKHATRFGNGGAQMYAYDVDGDGDNDVITSIAAHGFGLAWFENTKDGGQIKFIEHRFMDDTPQKNRYGLKIAQLHAVDLIDMDGDGLKDIVTGKRFWAHGPGGDVEPNAPPEIYWFKLVRRGQGAANVDFVPYLIHNDSGVGTQVVAGDINGDGLPDVVVGNKKGTYVHIHQVKQVNREQWLKAQPKPLSPKAAGAAANPLSGQPIGMLPVGKDGKPLNLDFEAGTLKDWTATGDAFVGQPIKGEIDKNRKFGADKHADLQGQYWIGGYELKEDEPQGTLTSVPFKVTAPFASFRVAGGAAQTTRVELVRADNNQVFFKTSGQDQETLRVVVVDMSPVKDKEIFIRLVDQYSGGWGHINFDDFRFHARKPVFPASVAAAPRPEDIYRFAGLSGQEAAKAMTLPPGFSVSLFAAEPDVKQPIAMTMDHRGRLWIAEAYSYPVRVKPEDARDRILIFEDTDGDGKFDTRKVFIEKLNLVSGLEVGFGGVWVGAAPNFMFIPDANGDDKPDGPPQVLLDGWGYQDTHETLNAFIWGPDGWLYGCHGVFTHSRVGKPGTPDKDRTPLNAGIWRYHPSRHVFEVFANGTSNPWGVDFNERGQCFLTCCVIPHLFHMIQGARYERQGGQDFNPYSYDLIKTIADHRHYVGNQWNNGDRARSDDSGGGHAHAGAMLYLGAAWPDKYRDQIFMNNIHGARINNDLLARKGSGFVGSHGPDFMLANDIWSQIINLRYGPDGQVYMIDWYDKNQCHNGNPAVHDRSNGRIYKVSYSSAPKSGAVGVDLNKLSDAELVKLQLNRNDWYVRHARRLLQERAATGKLDAGTHAALVDLLQSQKDDTRKLRALWALHVTGGLDEKLAIKLLDSPEEYVRAWAIQLVLEDKAASPAFVAKLASMAAGDPSPVVRLYLASALQRLPLEQRWDIAAALIAHGEDADDHNLPLMDWYGLEPLVAVDKTRALGLAAKAKIPIVRQFIARRLAAIK